MRNPVDFIASHHSQVISEGGEPVHDLAEALGLEPERAAGRHMPEAFRWRRTLLYREIASFSGQIARYLEVFGRDNVHIVVFDDLRADTQGQFARVLSFLDIDATFRPSSFAVVNANKRMRSKALMDFAVRNPPSWASITARAILPPSARNAIKLAVKRLNTRYEPRREMSPKLRATLTR
ncbi:MAG: sulfotransferase domain-containing protein, partial [Alphaproteobacteria bacterium]|nr:sulfotransferase domain-containing protein [Alphaproteobacteria bacterium]